MINEKVLIGYPIVFKDICLIYPPKIKDIVAVGYEIFLSYLNILTLTQEDLDDIYIKKNETNIPTPFQFLFMRIEKGDRQLVKQALSFFCKTKVTFLEQTKKIVLGEIKDKKIINDDNFFDFQNALRTSIGAKEAEKPNPNMHPKLKRMKAKQRERDRVKSKQDKNKCSFATQLLSYCCMDLGITLQTIGEYTYAGLNSLIRIKQQKNKYDLDISYLLAGANPKKVKPKDWMVDADKY